MDSHERNAPPRLPSSQLTILSICRFAEPLALTSVFPYLPEMIESFHVPKTEIAKWAGITSAVFSIAQFFTAIPWGRASDRFGRKPVILCAMTCAMASSLLFGFSRSLKWAIVARACSGASNGNVGILRTTVAEMVPQKELQPKAFAILPLVWQIGSILGPILGGALASPATKLPAWFREDKFLTKFPYALPNLVAAVFFTIGILTGVLFLKESLETKKDRKDYGRMLGDRLCRCYQLKRRKASLRPADDFENRLPKAKNDHQPPPPTRYRDVFSPQSNLNLLAYCILALHGVTYDQLLPVFMHLPVNRRHVHLPFQFSSGFGLESGRIGLIFTVYAVVSMILQFTLFPAVTRRFGALKCMRGCTLIFPIAYLLTPYTVLVPTQMGQQAVLLVVMLLKAVANVFAFPCVTILLTNSAKSLKLLGTLNGVAVSLSAIGRGAGPYMAGTAFTWGVTHGYGIAPWWLLAVWAAAGHVVTWWLKELDGFSSVPEIPGKEEDTTEMVDLDDNNNTPNNAEREFDPRAFLGKESEFEVSDDDDDDSPTIEGRPLLQNRVP
jgi:MFS family permease